MKTRVLRGVAILVAIVLFSMLGLCLYIISQGTRLFWLKSDSYMLYEQLFSWDGRTETAHTIWKVMGLSGEVVVMEVQSYGVSMSQGKIHLTLGKVDFAVKIATREIVNSSDLDYVGRKWPFWIETRVTLGSTVEALYGKSMIKDSETIFVLGQQRDCWIVEYNWATSSMKRWYDKSLGALLKTNVELYRQGVKITVAETALKTNITWSSSWPSCAMFSCLSLEEESPESPLQNSQRSLRFLGKAHGFPAA